MALLENPSDPGLADGETSTALTAAHRLGLELHILHASDERDFNGVCLKLTEMRAGGLVIGTDVLFSSHFQQIAALVSNTRFLPPDLGVNLLRPKAC